MFGASMVQVYIPDLLLKDVVVSSKKRDNFIFWESSLMEKH